jgi:membrane-associated protease RseP (regulator of RpoE activity)
LNALGVPRRLWKIIAGHTILTLPVVTLLVLVRLEGLDRNQEIAALDSGARPWRAFLTVSVPQALPGILAGTMFALAISMDEFILTFLVTGSQQTLPLYIFGSLRIRVTHELNAIVAQQRVVLARALVKRPAVLLLDEALGALDLRVRRQMQDGLVRIKRSTGTTLVHVTHDQEEACAIADRIAVMKDGLIAQVDTPEALCRAPRSSYVAGFIDAGTIVRGRNTVAEAPSRYPTPT